MNFDLSDEQVQIRDTFARFCDERIAPRAAEIDEAHAFPRELFGEVAALGFFGLRYPPESGGLGLDLISLCLALEEISRGSMSLAGCVTMQSLMGTKFLEMLGNADIKQRLFAPALGGEKIGGICMTEPNAGSDLGGIVTSARKVDGGYLLKGQKMWVTSAPVADFFTVFARAGDEKKLTIFLVEKDFKGLIVGKAIAKMGVWAMPTSELAFDDCFVPDSHRLSHAEGDGEGHLRKLLAEIRIVTGALALGGARGALEEAIRYAGERQQFGKPINPLSSDPARNSPRWRPIWKRRAAWCTTPPGSRTTTSRTTKRRRWRNCSLPKPPPAFATRRRACWRPTVTAWNMRCSATCATSASL